MTSLQCIHFCLILGCITSIVHQIEIQCLKYKLRKLYKLRS